MTAAERARRWFQRHAQARYDAAGTLVAFGVDWSEEVEASLAAEFSAEAASVVLGIPGVIVDQDYKPRVIPVVPPPEDLPNHEPCPNRSVTSRSNWVAPHCQPTEQDVESWS